MAGDWIKMRVDLADDPAVIGMAVTLGIEEDTVVGKLHRLWAWASRHTADGNAPVSERWIDRFLDCHGFAQAMRQAGWLEFTAGGILFPNFERHNGETAKARALATRRQQHARNKDPVAQLSRSQRDISVTREEKSREEKKEGDESPSTPLAPSGQAAASEPPAASQPDNATAPPTASAGDPANGDGVPAVMTFPIVGGATEWHLTAAKIVEYAEAFPALNIEAECRKALQWCRDNATKRKTAKGMPAFLFRWLGKAQNAQGGFTRNGYMHSNGTGSKRGH